MCSFWDTIAYFVYNKTVLVNITTVECITHKYSISAKQKLINQIERKAIILTLILTFILFTSNFICCAFAKTMNAAFFDTSARMHSISGVYEQKEENVPHNQFTS